jgi:hypothetical protein
MLTIKSINALFKVKLQKIIQQISQKQNILQV